MDRPVIPGSDPVDYSKIVVPKPWGSEYLIFENGSVAVWILYIKPGEETSMHCHTTKRTSLVVLQGRVCCSTLLSSWERKLGQGLCLHEGVFHQTKGLSPEGAYVMEVETPVRKQDLIRLRDRYGRAGSSYESSDGRTRNKQNEDYFSFEASTGRRGVKRFEHSTVSFLRLNSHNARSDLSAFADSEPVCLLRGLLFDTARQAHVKPGSMLAAGALRRALNNHRQPDIDILGIGLGGSVPVQQPAQGIRSTGS